MHGARTEPETKQDYSLFVPMSLVQMQYVRQQQLLFVNVICIMFIICVLMGHL